MADGEFHKKLLTTIAIALGGALILGTLLIITGFDISNRAESIQAQRKEVLSRTQATAFLAQLKTDFEVASPVLAKLDRILPTKDQLISFPKDLEGLAEKAGVDFGFSFGNESPGSADQAGSIQFVMTVAGKYDDLVRFFNFIKTSDYLVAINSTDLNRRGDVFSGVVSGRVFSR